MIDPIDTVTQPLPIVSNSLRFASEDRIYRAVLQQDLFSDWVVMQSWGGRYNQRGGGQTVPVQSFEEGCVLLQSIARRRVNRGYRLIE